MLLEGLHIPLTTPFHRDGRLNSRKLAANVARYSKSPASGLAALAPLSGELTLLDDPETREVLRTVAEAAAPEKVLLGNISRDSVAATLDLAELAAQLLYDGILIALPGFLAEAHSAPENGQHFPEVRLYFQAIADRSPLPVVLVSSTQRSIPPQLIAELAAHPNIVGLFDSTAHTSEPPVAASRDATVTMTFAPVTRRMLRASEATAGSIRPALISAAALAHNPATAAVSSAPATASTPALRTRTRVVGFQVIAASPGHLLDSLSLGAAAIAPAFAACAPQACYEVFAAWKDADQPLALEKQQRILEPARYAELLGPAGLKFGCDLNGYFGGLARLPHLPLTADRRDQLQRLMISTGT